MDTLYCLVERCKTWNEAYKLQKRVNFSTEFFSQSHKTFENDLIAKFRIGELDISDCFHWTMQLVYLFWNCLKVKIIRLEITYLSFFKSFLRTIYVILSPFQMHFKLNFDNLFHFWITKSVLKLLICLGNSGNIRKSQKNGIFRLFQRFWWTMEH